MRCNGRLMLLLPKNRCCCGCFSQASSFCITLTALIGCMMEYATR
jgi:hypothetical protein